MRTALAVSALVLLAACGATDEPNYEQPAPAKTAAAASQSADDGLPDVAVAWDNYAPEVKANAERLAKKGNCGGLQDAFDSAMANDDTQRSRTGEGNADLMDWLDQAMQNAGCY